MVFSPMLERRAIHRSRLKLSMREPLWEGVRG